MRFLDIAGQSAKGIANIESPIQGSKHLGLLESRLGIGAKGMHDGPKLQAMLKSVGSKDVLDDLRSEFVFGMSHEGREPKLGVGGHGWFTEEAFAWTK
jgi:hypothetical protein